METINLDVLTRPFTPEQIRQREGRGGKMLDYLETHVVITRLNEAFAGAWSFEAVEYKTLEGEIVVKGRLTAGGITKEQFGSNEIHRHKAQDGEKGAPVSIGDDLKAAASDALKKCATLFGVGLQLYAEKGQRPQQQRPAQGADRRPGPGQTAQQRPVSGPARSGSGPAHRQPVNGTGRTYPQR